MDSTAFKTESRRSVIQPLRRVPAGNSVGLKVKSYTERTTGKNRYGFDVIPDFLLLCQKHSLAQSNRWPPSGRSSGCIAHVPAQFSATPQSLVSPRDFKQKTVVTPASWIRLPSPTIIVATPLRKSSFPVPTTAWPVAFRMSCRSV